LNFPYPDIHSQPDLLYLRICIKQLSAHFNTKVPVAAITLNPVDMPIMIYGLDKWLEYFLFDKQAFSKTIDYIIPFFVEFTNALITDGAACVIMPTAFANSNTVTRDQTINIVNPILKSAFLQIKGGLVMHHGGVPFLPYLDTYSDFPENVLGFGMDWTDDYIEARRKIGFERLIFHGIDGPSLYLKDKKTIRETCSNILEMTQMDKKHVLYTCSSDILSQTPDENILTMGDAVKEFYLPRNIKNMVYNNGKQ
jgi:uroporphyrinogen decarboxylase